MNRWYRIITVCLVAMFIAGCFCFAGSAEEEGPSTAVSTSPSSQDTSTDSSSVEVPSSSEESTTGETTTQPETTTQETLPTTTAFAVITRPTERTTEYRYTTYDNNQYVTEGTTADRDATKTTRSSGKHDKTTKKTTVKKNIDDYSSPISILRWVSLVLMIGSVIALVAVNIVYYQKGRR